MTPNSVLDVTVNPDIGTASALTIDAIRASSASVSSVTATALVIANVAGDAIGLRVRRREEVQALGVGGRAHRLVFAETFASVPAGELVLHEDSFGSLAVAVNQGRAADRRTTPEQRRESDEAEQRNPRCTHCAGL